MRFILIYASSGSCCFFPQGGSVGLDRVFSFVHYLTRMSIRWAFVRTGSCISLSLISSREAPLCRFFYVGVSRGITGAPVGYLVRPHGAGAREPPGCTSPHRLTWLGSARRRLDFSPQHCVGAVPSLRCPCTMRPCQPREDAIPSLRCSSCGSSRTQVLCRRCSSRIVAASISVLFIPWYPFQPI